jgi:Prokaryotic phospholipase A2
MRAVPPRLIRTGGQASLEHVGLVLLLALVLGALAAVQVAPDPATAIVRAICAGVGGDCRERSAAESTASGRPTEAEIVDRYIEADLDTFLAYRGSPDRDPRLDWSTDECSAPVVGSTGASFDFTEACLRHDFGYRNYRRLGLFEQRKGLVDDRFLGDMRAHCETRRVDERERCRTWALAFYLAVHHLGHLVGRRPE